MKQLLLSLTFLLTITTISQAQDRYIARGAEPGELYITGYWYAIFDPVFGPPKYDTAHIAVFHITEYGKKLAIQYDFNVAPYNPEYEMLPGSVLADATSGAVYNTAISYKSGTEYTYLWVSFDYGKNWAFREENMGAKGYFAANIEGLIYRTGFDGYYEISMSFKIKTHQAK